MLTSRGPAPPTPKIIRCLILIRSPEIRSADWIWFTFRLVRKSTTVELQPQKQQLEPKKCSFSPLGRGVLLNKEELEQCEEAGRVAPSLFGSQYKQHDGDKKEGWYVSVEVGYFSRIHNGPVGHDRSVNGTGPDREIDQA